jgi:hypothetical protein
MKTLALLFAPLALFAQTPLTTVTHTIYDAVGQPVTGSCTLRLASGRARGAAGGEIVGEPVTVRFTNGAFSAQVVPTDTQTPSMQYYSINCSGTRGWSKSGAWIVPTSVSPVDWDAVWVNAPPSPPITFLPAQIYAGGLSTGTYCLSVTNGAVTGLAPCSGGGGALSWSGLTNGQWSGLTNGQWTGMTN